jgi:tRNA(Ile)-lysidine synthase
MNLPDKFKEHWKENFYHLSPVSCHLVLAVSGGIDSVVLADLLFNAGFNFSIAHCNFQLRDEESNRDEAFVRSLGERYGVEVYVKRFDTLQYAEVNKIGIQEAARDLRYEWFEELVDGCSMNVEWKHSANDQPPTINLLVTAHHSDDNVETVLFNIFRGTGMNGLHGILPQQGKIIRPLLFAKREQILSYAKEHELVWVEDSSNASSKYTRNYIRHEVLPMLKQIFPSVMENVSSSIERWREGEELYIQAIALHKKKLCELKGNEVLIPVLKLQKTTPVKTITFEIIKEFGFTTAQTEEVLALLESESGKYVASASHRIIKNRNWFIIAPLQSEQAENILIEEGEKKIVFNAGELEIELIQNSIPKFRGKIQNDSLTAALDAADIQFPLLLRKWKQGDYFYPLGMRKKKKLSRFFIDQKLSATEKEKAWVVESNKKILWVVGYRIDDRFKITDSTKQVLKLTFQTSS